MIQITVKRIFQKSIAVNRQLKRVSQTMTQTARSQKEDILITNGILTRV